LISSGFATYYGPEYNYTGKLTTIYQIGRVCTYGYPYRYLTLVFKHCGATYGPTVVLTKGEPVYQHWVKVFDDNLSSKNQFHLVSFPFLDYVLKVTDVPNPYSSGSSSLAISAVKLPIGFYVHGAAFKKLGPEFTFQDTVSYTDGTVNGTWNYVKHVDSGYYLDCLINHPHCGASYDPVYLSLDTSTPSTISGGVCTCTVDKRQWRYFD
jgi:hypothetical protein